MAKKIGVNDNGRAWISPAIIKTHLPLGPGPWRTDYKRPTVSVEDINSHSYKILKDIINRGNAICSRPYRMGGGHGLNLNNHGAVKRNGAWDCSSSASCILHPHLYKPSLACVSDTFATLQGFTSRGRVNKQKSIVIYANPEHVFLDIWWQGSRITWDNWGGRGSHTPWYPSSGSPDSPSAYKYKIVHKNL
jgi:hypothetical protein